MFRRGTKRGKDSGVIFSRDHRMNITRVESLSLDDHLIVAKKLQCPLLLIEFEDGPRETFNDDILETLKKHNSLLEYHMLPGTHHQHLNDPESVNSLVVCFIMKIKSKL